MTYELDSVMVASNIHNDEQLGQFVIENDLHPNVAAIPEDSLYLLDKRRIGELQRQNDGGVLIDGFYVVTGDYEIPEVYDGKNIPAAADDGVFRLKVGPADLNNPVTAEARAVWIALPIPRADADAIVKDAFGVDSIEDSFCFEFESGIPQITAIAAKEKLGLFDFSHCSEDADYAGKLLILKPSVLKDEYKASDYQLFYAESGFGCSPSASGRKVFGKFLKDGENTNFNRSDFLGVIKDECIPEWAAEKLAELEPPDEDESEGITMGGI